MWVVVKNNPYSNAKNTDTLSVSMTVSLFFHSCFLFSFHGTASPKIHKDRLDPVGLPQLSMLVLPRVHTFSFTEQILL